MQNQSVSEFTLVGFPIGRQAEILLACVVLAMYLVSVVGNIVILFIVCADSRLHTPMYFFLGNYSMLDILFTSVISPQLLWNTFSNDRSISFVGCMTQSYFYFFLGSVEFLLMTSMSYDRYAAICKPLQYHAVMNGPACVQLLLGCWLGGFLAVLFPTILITRLPYCKSNIINHFFCDSGPLLNLACTDTRLIELIDFVLSSVIIVFSLILILVSYMYIISAIMSISTTTGRAKAFNTCATHLTIVSMTFSSSIFMYVTPSQQETLEVHKIPAILTTVVCPFLNPFIFTLKNDSVKQAMRDITKRSRKFFAQEGWGFWRNKGAFQ